MSQLRPPRYLKPMNKFMMAVQKLGIPTGPAMVLTVPGRKTGKPRSTPMTPFEHDGGHVGVLLSHGFTGSPHSMWPWGDAMPAPIVPSPTTPTFCPLPFQ